MQTTGDVLDSARDCVRKQVAAFLRRLPDPLQQARIKLTASTRSGMPWAALVQANLEVDEQPIRAQAATTFFHQAGRLLRERLMAQMARLADPAAPRPWPPDRSEAPTPVSRLQAEIVRRKCYQLARCTPDQAALTMDVMDFDFHLFVDAETGQDSVIYRVGPTGYRLARLAGMAPPSAPVAVPLTINVHEVPRLTPEQAVNRLNATELPFRFFRDAATDRGAVLYRRYDGHCGLITPATEQHRER